MRSVVLSILSSGLLVSAAADAHVEVGSGPAIANANNKITFAVGHGCEDDDGRHYDTVSVKIDIPAGVTGVRALPSSFGRTALTFDATNTNITSITWTKPTDDIQDTDSSYYEVTLRARTPNAPFTSIPFSVTQTCRDRAGTQPPIVVAWDQPPGSTTGSPAPVVKLVPARRTGWNKVTVPASVTLQTADLAAYFGDAQIVWRGNAAYSASTDVTGMIAATTGVTALAGPVLPGDVLWVRY